MIKHLTINQHAIRHLSAAGLIRPPIPGRPGNRKPKDRCDYYSEQHGISIVKYFYERYSGRKPDRIVLEEILDFVKAHKSDISTLIIGNIDRFTRAGADIYIQLKKLFAEQGVDVIDASGVIQKPVNTLEYLGVKYDWSERSPSRLAEVLMAGNANAEATEILTRCIGGQIKKARKGYQFKSADFGYTNERVVMPDGRKAAIMVPEPTESAWVKTIFELRAEKALSDEQICRRLNAMGFRTRETHRYDSTTRQIIGKGGNKPLSEKTLRRMICRPVYCGFRCGKWTDHKLVKIPYDQALVSIRLFNKANHGRVIISQLGDEYHIDRCKRAWVNRKDTLEFGLRHVVTCPLCRQSFVASKSRGKSGKYFGYYHCNRKHKYYGVNAREFESTVANTIHRITVKKKYLRLLKEVARDV